MQAEHLMHQPCNSWYKAANELLATAYADRKWLRSSSQ
jgi:hypothetical protein